MKFDWFTFVILIKHMNIGKLGFKSLWNINLRFYGPYIYTKNACYKYILYKSIR